MSSGQRTAGRRGNNELRNEERCGIFFDLSDDLLPILNYVIFPSIVHVLFLFNKVAVGFSREQ
jgi:hypothetical protein